MQPFRHIAASALLLLVFGCATTENASNSPEQDLAGLRQQLNQGEEITTKPLLRIIQSETSPPLPRARAAALAARILAEDEASPAALEMAERSLRLYDKAMHTVSVSWLEVSMPFDIAVLLAEKFSGVEAALHLAKKYGRSVDRENTSAWSRKPSGEIVHNPTKITVPITIGEMTLLHKSIFEGESDSFALTYADHTGMLVVDYMSTGGVDIDDYGHHVLLAEKLSAFTQSPPVLRRIQTREMQGIVFPGYLVDHKILTGREKIPGHAGSLILDADTHFLRVRYALHDSAESEQTVDMGIFAAIITAIRWPEETAD